MLSPLSLTVTITGWRVHLRWVLCGKQGMPSVCFENACFMNLQAGRDVPASRIPVVCLLSAVQMEL